MNEKFFKIKLNYIVAVLLLIGVLCSRPMILGNKYSLPGLVILLSIACIYIIKSGLKIISGSWEILISMLIFFTYCILQALILQSNQLQIAFQTYILLVGIAIAFYVLLTNHEINYYFFKIFIVVLSVLVVSYIVSFVLSLSKGWDKLLLFQYNYGYFTDSNIFFPFTVTYGSGNFMNIKIWRLLSIFRESGIAQIFYIWAFFMSDKYFKRHILIRALMAIGVFVCFSTTGFIVFIVSLFFSLDFKKFSLKKIIMIAAMSLFLIYCLWYAQGSNLADKAQSSITDRTIAIETGIENFKEHPLFGVGFYSNGGNGIQSDICLIASIGQIGIVGICLYFIIYFISYKNAKSKRRYIVALVPMLITTLFSQPLAYAPIVYMLFFVNYDDNKLYLQHRINN